MLLYECFFGRCFFKIQQHYTLSISQVDPSKGGVKFWSWLTLMVFIKKDRRTADLHTQLLCSLKLLLKLIRRSTFSMYAYKKFQLCAL